MAFNQIQFQPVADTTRMRSLELRIPPPLVAAVLLLSMWLLPLYPQPAFLDKSLRMAWAVVLVVLGQGLALAGVVAFRRARTTINPVRASEASTLVRGGIYRLTRNPMYLGWVLTLLAWAVYLGNLLSFIFVPIFVWYITRFQIKPEERVLTQRFGTEFVSYACEVRRWI